MTFGCGIMIKGFKCFYSGLINAFGQQLELDKKYIYKGEIKFRSSGYHLCTNLEDTLRYFDGMNKDVDICEVIGYPEYAKFEDEYYGYYDMYACQGILLKKILTRDEIIEKADNMHSVAFKRFSAGYKLTKEELDYFKNKYKNDIDVLQHLIYWYEDKNIYNKISRR